MTSRAASTLIVMICLLVSGVVLSVKVASFWLSRAQTQSLQPPPQLAVAPADLDFGDAWEQAEFHWQIPVKNASRQSLTLKDVQARCDCTSIEPRKLVIAPGEVKTLKLQIDLTRERWKSGESLRAFEMPITASIGESRQTLAWKLTGTVRRNPMQLSTDLLDLQEVSSDAASAGGRVSLDLPPESSLQNLRAECLPPGAGSVELTPLEEAGRYELHVVPAATLPAGKFSFRVRITGSEPGAQFGPSRDLAVIGEIRRPVVSTPTGLEFGAIMLGKTSGDVITFTPFDPAPFQIRIVRTSGPEVTAEAESPSSDGTVPVTCRVHQAAGDAGAQHGWVEFEILVANREPERVVIPTSYYGTTR